MVEAKKVNYKFPKNMGACADLLYMIKAEKAQLSAQIAVIEVREKALRDYVINTLPKSEATGISGKVANVKISTKEVPQVDDWDVLYKHVLKTKSFTLLQRRLSDATVKEIWADGKEVPGIKHFNAVVLSLTKI